MAFDLETTGLARDAEIVSIGWCARSGCNSHTDIDEISGEVLCMPVGPIDEGASLVHGHTAATLAAAGAGNVLDALQAFFAAIRSAGDDVVLVAHNGKSFDTPKLRSAMLACGLDLPPNVSGFVDTLLWARSTGRYRSCTLDSLMRSHGIYIDRAVHGALVDSRALVAVLSRMLEEAGERGVPACAFESATDFIARTASARPCPLVRNDAPASDEGNTYVI